MSIHYQREKEMKVLKDLKSKKLSRNVRFTNEEWLKICKSAEKYAGGNSSAWLRYASLNFKPKEEDLVEKKIS